MKSRVKLSSIFSIAILTFGIMSISCSENTEANTTTKTTESTEANDTDTKQASLLFIERNSAPDFTLETLDGKEIKLSDLKGSVVFLDFWATWCGPCVKALPHTQKMSETEDAKQGKMHIFAVNVGEDKDTVNSFMSENRYTFTVLMDRENKVAASYEVEGIPRFIVIDKNGRIAWEVTGAPPGIDETIDTVIQQAIEE